MSAPVSRVAGRVFTRRLFSSSARKNSGIADEFRGFFKAKSATPSQPLDWGKIVRTRSVTFGIYATFMTTVLGWPYLGYLAYDGRM
ncbi:hypothetical protein BX600DRAFT_449017 [Xylariales sp. PMI_506]|nr:hypothetical protein BX600DRAFT_449017 [Xylariales sp. PMI_506]